MVKSKRKPAAAESEGFWDKPALMNLVSDILMLASCSVLAYAAVMAAQRLPVLPLREVTVENPLRRVTAMQVDYAVRDAVNGNFFVVNLDTVRASFEKLPWVRRADVRRHWPDALDVTIEEHVAVARWKRPDGESRLVNDHGEVFAASADADLPAFAGPEGAAGELLASYHGFNRTLAPLGRKSQAITLSPRRAWQLRLDDGLLLELGREDPQHPVAERMARFVASYKEVQQKAGARLTSIDMRYPNGFAVRAANTEKKS